MLGIGPNVVKGVAYLLRYEGGADPVCRVRRRLPAHRTVAEQAALGGEPYHNDTVQAEAVQSVRLRPTELNRTLSQIDPIFCRHTPMRWGHENQGLRWSGRCGDYLTRKGRVGLQRAAHPERHRSYFH